MVEGDISGRGRTRRGRRGRGGRRLHRAGVEGVVVGVFNSCRSARIIVVVDSIVRLWSSAPVGSVAQVVGSGSGSSRLCQVVALARLRRGRGAVVLVAAGSGPSRSCGRAVVLVLVDSCGSAIRRGAAVSRAAAAPLVVRLGWCWSYWSRLRLRRVRGRRGAHSLTR